MSDEIRGENKESVSVQQDVNVLSRPLKRVFLRDVATMRRKVSNMDLKKIKRRYRWFKYDAETTDMETIRKNLTQCLAEIMTKNIDSIYRNENVLPYYVVVDFEATCEAQNPVNYHHEIIEFPAVLINSATLEIEDKFRYICRPTIKPKLSNFCVELTGITQKEVDAAEPFPRVLKLFEDWLAKHGLGTDRKFAVVTDGPWDMCRFLFGQCMLSNVEYPSWAAQWLDLRHAFRKFYSLENSFLRRMLEHLRLSFEGRPHCGIDDATNIARVLLHVICDGAILFPNQKILAEEKRASILSLVNSNEDLVPQLTGLSIEAVCEFVPWHEKLPTSTDIKMIRSMRIHALTKILNNGETSYESVLADAQCGLEKLRIQNLGRKKKKGKKKRNF